VAYATIIKEKVNEKEDNAPIGIISLAALMLGGAGLMRYKGMI
jgi:hypothetical protein